MPCRLAGLFALFFSLAFQGVALLMLKNGTNISVTDPVISAIENKNLAIWLSWTLPDADFVLQEKHTLNDAYAPSAVTPILNGATRHLLLHGPDLLDQTYYGLKK